MKILFEKVLPHPIREIEHKNSAVWSRDELCIEPSQRIEVLAPSGKGKSTFLSMLYGLRKDYEGIIWINGENIRHWPAGEWVRQRKRHISMVFQGLELFPELTAFENIHLKNRLTNHLKKEQIQAIADRLEVSHFLNKKIAQLSFGQQQRFALIRALAMPFDLLLLDEPFSHLNEALKKTAWALITEHANKNEASVILAALDPSHLPEIQTQLEL